MSYLVHIAYVLYLASYSVQDMLWLRLLTVVASVPLLPYYYFQPEALWAPMAWLVVFMLVNLLQASLLLRERRPAVMTPEQTALHARVFRPFRPRTFLRFLGASTSRRFSPGETVIEAGAVGRGLYLVTAGRARVQCEGRTFAFIDTHEFMGGMSYATGDGDVAEIVAHADLEVLHWESEALTRCFRNRPDLHATLSLIVARDLVVNTRRNTGPLPQLTPSFWGGK